MLHYFSNFIIFRMAYIFGLVGIQKNLVQEVEVPKIPFVLSAPVEPKPLCHKGFLFAEARP